MRFFLILIMICSSACAQEHKETMKTSRDISLLHKEVKKYNEEPIYKLTFTSSECSFYLLVNDIPLYKFFGKSGGVGATSPINWYIEKSGRQKITIKMYPRYNPESQKMDKKLGLNAGIGFNIERERNKEEDETIFEFKTPFKDFDGKGGGGFVYPERSYYEETIGLLSSGN